MKKILHLQTELNIACGVSKTIYLLIKNLNKEYKQDVICLGGDGLSRFNSISNMPIVIDYNRKTIIGNILIIKFLISFCKKNRIDIIHSHHRYFDFIVFLIRRFLYVKTIMSVHSKVFGFKTLSYKSDIIIACSKNIKSHLIEYFKIKSNKIIHISNFIDLTEKTRSSEHSNLRSDLKIPKKSVVLSFIGRIDNNEKGLDILLYAFKKLSISTPEVFLLIVGNGQDKEEAQKYLKLNNLNAKIIDAEVEIFKYYYLSDIIILPSRIEPFGLVILESGAVSKPFIGSNVDGIAELIRNGENGLLFEKDDSDGLKNCILKMIKDKDYSDKLANTLHKEITEKYSVETIIPKYYSLYESISKN